MSTAMLATDTHSTLDPQGREPGGGPFQIDAGWNIAILMGTTAPLLLLAEVVTTEAPPATLTINPAPESRWSPRTNPPPSTEMWWLKASSFNPSCAGLTIGQSSFVNSATTLLDPSFNPQGATFKSGEVAVWTASTTTQPKFAGTPYYFQNAAKDSPLWVVLDVSGTATFTINGLLWCWTQSTLPTKGTIDPNGVYNKQDGAPTVTYQWAWSRPS